MFTKSQLRPRSKLTWIPPSLPSSMWSEFAGSIQSAWKSPWILSTTSVLKVLPPSSEVYMDAPSTQMRRSLAGSIRILL